MQIAMDDEVLFTVDTDVRKNLNKEMALFPHLEDDEPEFEDELVLLPGANNSVTTAKVKSDPASDAMKALSFPSPEKLSFHGLPMRVKWLLWVQLMEWHIQEKEMERLRGYQVYAKVEVGEDGHYFCLKSDAGLVPKQKVDCKLLMDVYHQRSSNLRLSLCKSSDDSCIAYALVALKDLVADKPKVGWVKVKDPVRDDKGKRRGIGTVHIGMKISPSVKAETLFLIDTKQQEVMFFQGVETLEDLNPVFLQPSMTPFHWTLKNGLVSFYNSQKKELCTLEKKVVDDTRVVSIVRADVAEYWQCSVTYIEEAKNTECMVEGSWRGSVKEFEKSVSCSFVEIKTSDSKKAAHGEARNTRDIKLSVDKYDEDPLIMIALVVASRMARMKK